MSEADETPGPEPEELTEEELDKMEYLISIPPAYQIDGRDYHNPFPAFNADDPETTYNDDSGALPKTPPIPEGLYQHRNLDPLGKFLSDKNPTALKVHKLKFCDAAPALLRGIVHALAELSKDKDSEIRDRAQGQLAFAARAIGLDLSGSNSDLPALHTLAEALTAQLDASAHKHVKEAQQIARDQHTWPVLLSARKNQQDRVSEFLKSLGLSAEHTSRALNTDTAINDYTTQLFEYVNRMRRIKILEKPNSRIRVKSLMPVPDLLFDSVQLLKALDESNAEEWFKVVWDVLLHFTNGMPETFYLLEELGVYQVEDARNVAQKPRSINADEQSARSGIKRRMRQSVLTLAKNL